MRKVLGVVLAVAVAGLLSTMPNRAEARPQYLKAFQAKYPAVKEAAKIKCGVCHPEKSKKVRNDYGKAMGAGLGKKNQKDVEKLKTALTDAEAKKAKGDTFGAQLKEGKLPK